MVVVRRRRNSRNIRVKTGFGSEISRGHWGRIVLEVAWLHTESRLGTRGTVPGTFGIPGKAGAPGILNKLDGRSSIGITHTGSLA